jgi:hypothetical protein
MTARPALLDWTTSEDARLLRMVNDDNVTWWTVSNALGRPAAAVKDRYDELMHLIMWEKPRPTPRRVKCLSCQTPFLSKDPRRIRRCTACRDPRKLEGMMDDTPEAELSTDGLCYSDATAFTGHMTISLDDEGCFNDPVIDSPGEDPASS